MIGDEYSSNQLPEDQQSLCNSSTSIDEGYGKSQTSSNFGTRSSSLFQLNNNDSNHDFLDTNNGLSYNRIVDMLDYLTLDDDRLYEPELRIVCTFAGKLFRSSQLDFIDTPKSCRLCKRYFSNGHELNEHVKSFSHLFSLDTGEYLPMGLQSTFCMPHLVMVDVSAVEKNGKDVEHVQFAIKNKTKPTDSKIAIQLLYVFCVDLMSQEMINIDNGLLPFFLPSNTKIRLTELLSRFEMGKKYKLIVYYSINSMDYVNHYDLIISRKPPVTLKLNKLNLYFPDADLRSLQRHNFQENAENPLTLSEKDLLKKLIAHKNAYPRTRLNHSNYKDIFKTMIQMEDEIASKRALSHDQYNQMLIHVNHCAYSIQTQNNERLENAIFEYDRLWVTPMSLRIKQQHQQQTYNGRRPKQIVRSKRNRIYGVIVEKKQNIAIIKFDECLSRFQALTGVQQHKESYFIRFMNNRTTYKLEHQALEAFSIDKPFGFVFPDAGDVANIDCSKYLVKLDEELEWTTPDINSEQKIAVKYMLNRTAFPLPYILFGPPGTGKTKTLIEAISQIVKSVADSRILVCASSNSACNEIGQRLMKIIAEKRIFRMFSQAIEVKTIPNDIRRISNLADGDHYYPDLAVLCQYKIVVCTLTTAGRFVQANMNTDHFNHIFIDECGSATETQTLIAIAGLCTSKNNVNASVVFAGDPKQLGPVIKCSLAQKMGYDISMLERLMATDPYKKNLVNGEYDKRYIMQLIRNYRSHPVILHVPNELFYESTLTANAHTDNINWFISSKLLPCKEFPMIFHSVKGETQLKGRETSPFNRAEIAVVISYVKKLLEFNDRNITENDIGIISPYKKQSEEIQIECTANGWTNIQTGAVEIFQGQEKPIIIVSTVRSNVKSLGFLDNPKRLNVLLTRAKSLLIIAGNENTLGKDKNWARVIDYCKANNALVQ